MNKVITAIVVIVAVLLFGWFVWPGRDGGTPGKTTSPTVSPTFTPPSQASPTPTPTATPSPTLLPGPDGTISLSGELKASDNKTRGNLMFVTDSAKIYINTSRDFSGLIGKKTEIIIRGSLDSFVLVDIKEK